jgi:hypothetical protein
MDSPVRQDLKGALDSFDDDLPEVIKSKDPELLAKEIKRLWTALKFIAWAPQNASRDYVVAIATRALDANSDEARQ